MALGAIQLGRLLGGRSRFVASGNISLDRRNIRQVDEVSRYQIGQGIICGAMRTFQALAGMVALFAVGFYLWGHHFIAALLGWVVFPLLILADFVIGKRKSG
jgi:hypothetical protein